MPSRNTKFPASPQTARRLLFLLGVVALWCAHAFSLWAGTLWYFVTHMVLFLATFVLVVCIVRIQVNEPQAGRPRPLSPYLTSLVVALLVTLCFFLSPLPNYIKDAGIRHRIQTVSDETRLQAWAEQILQAPLNRLPVKLHSESDNRYYLDDRQLPDYVRHIPIGGFHEVSYCLVDEGSRGRYLQIYIWHGRPESWGILLCLPSYDPTGMKDYWIRRWRTGMYGWQDINVPPG